MRILTILFIVILLQKLVLIAVIQIYPNLKNNFDHGDMGYYLTKQFSVLPYYYWRSLWSFNNLADLYPQVIAFSISALTLITMFLVLKRRIYLRGEAFYLIGIFMILNPYYNLYFIKNTADFLTMNLLIIFYLLLNSGARKFSLLVAPIILLGKPFMAAIIGYNIYQKKLLPNWLLILGVLIIIFFTFMFDYNGLLKRLNLLIYSILTGEITLKDYMDYLSRIVSFLTQRERDQFYGLAHLQQYTLFNGYNILVAKMIVSVVMIFYAFITNRTEAMLIILTMLLVCLNAGHLRYAFIIAFAFAVNQTLRK
ncbi:hypothetical protein N9Q00_00370 [Amylibacter sp.]|nr:hypothetical protein [Amylibacter sp.]